MPCFCACWTMTNFSLASQFYSNYSCLYTPSTLNGAKDIDYYKVPGQGGRISYLGFTALLNFFLAARSLLFSSVLARLDFNIITPGLPS